MQQEFQYPQRKAKNKTASYSQSAAMQLWKTNLEVFQRDRLALIGLMIFAVFFLIAISRR